MEVRIICINKDDGNHQNPHEAISHYGWWQESTGNKGKWSRMQMVVWVSKQQNNAYVKDSFGNKVYCYIRKSKNGTYFLQTRSDGRDTNNLLELPECPLR